MRARYSAYVLVKENFILDSWAFETRPKELYIDSKVRWICLKEVDPEPVQTHTSSAIVSFTAIYLEDSMLHTLHERSTFIKRCKCWYYLEGESRHFTQQLAGNRRCPCGSGKKFKRCCLHNW